MESFYLFSAYIGSVFSLTIIRFLLTLIVKSVFFATLRRVMLQMPLGQGGRLFPAASLLACVVLAGGCGTIVKKTAKGVTSLATGTVKVAGKATGKVAVATIKAGGEVAVSVGKASGRALLDLAKVRRGDVCRCRHWRGFLHSVCRWHELECRVGGGKAGSAPQDV